MGRGEIRFTVAALATLLLCSNTLASAQSATCVSDKYEGQRDSSANLLFITEFNISGLQPVNLCPQKGAYYRQSGYLSAARSLPVYFWFRLEGDRSLTSGLIRSNVSVLRLRAVFERHVIGNSY